MRVLIVGAGIMGLCTAWALTRRGHEVVLLEQASSVPNPLAASGDQHRIIREAYGSADEYALAIDDAFEAWEMLWQDTGRNSYSSTSVLALSRAPDDNVDLLKRGLERVRTAHHILRRQEIDDRFPYLDTRQVRYGILCPCGGILHCNDIAQALVRWLATHRVNILLNQKVLNIDEQGARVTTVGNEYVGDRIVVTSGAWILSLFPHLSGMVKAFGVTVVYLEPPKGRLGLWERAPCIMDIGGDDDGYLVPPRRGTGLKIVAGSLRFPITSPEDVPHAETAAGEHVRDLFGSIIRGINTYRIANVTSCKYIFTSNNHFHTSKSGRCWIVSACSGHGYKFGAAIGQRMAAAVEADDPSLLPGWLAAH